MKWSLITRLLALSLTPLALATPDASNLVARSPDAKDSSSAESPEQGPLGQSLTPTTFNGEKVPPFKNINGEELESLISKGNWFVEFYSPHCPHCQSLAPTIQTLYELYYTSKPSDDVSFTEYYDFHFGRIDCVAYGSACEANEVKHWPTMIVFKNGKLLKKKVSGVPLADLSMFMEEVLELIKPGTRPKDGLPIPEVGADHAGDVKSVTKKPESEKGSTVDADEKESPKESKSKSKKTSSAKSKDRTEKSKSKAVVLPDYNPMGSSTPLTIEDFQNKVTTTQNPWFVKFYTKWCPHCQALAPTWASMARDMQGKMNIGEVDCEVEKTLCRDVHVHAYPTLIFFQGGERVEYKGLRGLGDLINFANKAAAAGQGVLDVTAEEFEELEKTEEVIFVYLYDHATTSEDFLALERVLLSLIGRARLVKSNDPALYKRFKVSTWPRLLVSRDGKPSYYTPLAPREMRDVHQVLRWMQTVWLPIVPELTAANAKEIMANKLVVLGILSRERSDEFIIAKREIKNAALEWIDKQTQAFQLERQELRDAKQLRIEEAEDRNDQRALRNAKSIRIDMNAIERKQVAFAWVDGAFWERWIKTTYGISLSDGERVVINDEENHRYWDTTITGNPIVPSRTSILETLQKVTANPSRVSPKSTANFFGHIYYALRGAFSRHPFLCSGALVILLALAALSLRSRRAGPGAVQLGGGNNQPHNGHLGGFVPAEKGEKKGWGSGGFLKLPLQGEKGGSGLGGLLGGNNGGGQKAD